MYSTPSDLLKSKMSIKLAEFLWMRYCALDEKKGYMAIAVPIDEIDNVKCAVWIKMNKKNIYLEIETDHSYINNDDETEAIPLCSTDKFRFVFEDKEIKAELFKIILDKWFLDISEFKFDKLTSIFQKADHIEMWEFLRTIENISIGEKCSCCYEPTKQTTRCGHYTCIPCLEKIKPKKDDDGDNIGIICPICRETVGY